VRRITFIQHGAYLLLTLLAGGLVGCTSENKASEVRFELNDGNTALYSELNGDYVLMNYWASWCKPCVKEIPELNHLDKHAKLDVFAYNFDRLEGLALEEQADKFKLRLPMMTNEPAPMFDEKSPQGLPATLIVNRHTGEKQWLIGPQTESGVLAKLKL